MKPDMALKIKEEIRKQLAAGFIKVSKYPEWIASVTSRKIQKGNPQMAPVQAKPVPKIG